MHKQYLIAMSGLVGITTLSGFALTAQGVNAVTSTKSATVTVSSSCGMTADVTSAHSTSLAAGTYENNIGTTVITSTCNDMGGYALYAVGYTGDTVGNNVLHSSTLASSNDIPTGIAQSGQASQWAMKLSSVTGTYAPTIISPYNDYASVPNAYTKVASFGSATDTANGSSVSTTYAVYVKHTQYAGNYSGAVKYVLVHPSTGAAPTV